MDDFDVEGPRVVANVKFKNNDEPGSFILPYTCLFSLFYHFHYITDPPLHTLPLQPHAQASAHNAHLCFIGLALLS